MSALEGMRVLDISQFESGPLCGQMLAWFGAEVVKIDAPLPASAATFESPLHLANNHNKRSLLLNLRSPEGRELFYKLVPRFDVVIENFAVGQAERLGLDYETLRKFNPGIIYCTIKGFGLTGPYSSQRAFDPVTQAACGAMSVTGFADGPPVRAGYVVSDAVSGVTGAAGVIAAWVQRLRTGEGQLVEVSMQEAMLNLVRSTLVGWENQPGGVVGRRGNRMTPPTDIYPCKPFGPSDWVQLTAPTDDLFARVLKAIGRPDLATDPRFATREARLAHGDELYAEVEKWTRERTKWEAMDELGSAGVPASAVFDSKDIFENRHLAERGAIATVTHPVRGETRLPGHPVRLHGSPIDISAPPVLGEHTDAILREELGLDDASLSTLREAGVIG